MLSIKGILKVLYRVCPLMDKSVSMWAKDPNEIEISHRSIITNKLITGNYNSLILI